MSSTIKVLAVVLIVQLLLVAGFNMMGDGGLSRAESRDLITLDTEVVDGLEIAGPDGAEVRLTLEGSSWQITQPVKFPADTSRVDRLLDRIVSLEVANPVADSRDAQARFKVGVNSFERKLTLTSAEGEQVLLLGTSPGMRRVHLRDAASDGIYAVDLATYDVPSAAKDWIDKSVLTVDAEDIAALEVDGLRISRSEDASGDNDSEADTLWLSESLDPGSSIDVTAAAELVSLLAKLRFDDLAVDSNHKSERSPVVSISIELADGEQRDYVFSGSDEAGFFLTVTGWNQLFKLASYQAEPVIEAATPDALVLTNDDSEDAVVSLKEDNAGAFAES